MASNAAEDTPNETLHAYGQAKDAGLTTKNHVGVPPDAVSLATDQEVSDENTKSGGKSSSPIANAELVEDGEISEDGSSETPPLSDEAIPPLPSEPLPQAVQEDDGWAPVWDESAQAFYFYNRFTSATQWTNPRVPEDSAPTVEAPELPIPRPAGGYDPTIHGDYDPTAWYAQPSEPEAASQQDALQDPSTTYAATAAFNRFTGRFQNPDIAPENFNDENKSKRQMNAFFDVDAAANSHDGRSLKEERSGKKLTKQELKKFKEKRKAKKEEKRKAWLRD